MWTTKQRTRLQEPYREFPLALWTTKQRTRLQEPYREFPHPYWTLAGVIRISGLLGLLAAAAYVGLHTRMREEPAAVMTDASD